LPPVQKSAGVDDAFFLENHPSDGSLISLRYSRSNAAGMLSRGE
jgi:hypothetical protein